MGNHVQYNARDGVAVLSMGGTAGNALTPNLRRDLFRQLEKAIGDPSCTCIVVHGARPGFSSGINLVEFDKALAPPLVDELCTLVENSPKPVVAALHGSVLGAGFALALAAHGRVAHSGTRFAFPDVRLGLIPSGGVTQRLPRLIGAQAALQIMGTGQSYGAKTDVLQKAITRLVDGDPVDEACSLAREMAQSGDWARTCDLRSGFSDSVAYFKSLTHVAERIKDPKSVDAAIVQCVEAALLLPAEQGLELDKTVFQKCLNSDRFRCARHAFVAERRVAKVAAAPPAGASDISNIVLSGPASALIDLSVMGLDAGWTVFLQPTDPRHGNAIRERVSQIYDGAVTRNHLKAEDRNQRLSRLETGVDGLDNTQPHIVVGLDAVSPKVGPSAVLVATELSEDLVRPRADGAQIWAHVYAPAHSSRLTEIAASDAVNPRHLSSVARAFEGCGKTLVRTKPIPGLVGRNLQSALWAAALCLAKAGASPFDIDRAARALGYVEGPFQQLDRQGLAVVARQMMTVAETRGASVARGFGLLERLSAAGESGRHKGVGFYRYDGVNVSPRADLDQVLADWRSDRSIEQLDLTSPEVQKALHSAVVNEAARLLSLAAVSRASDLDVILFNGLGYLNSMGGLLFQADLKGVFPLLQMMRRLQEIAPELWTPEARIEEMVKNGQGFYGRAT